MFSFMEIKSQVWIKISSWDICLKNNRNISNIKKIKDLDINVSGVILTKEELKECKIGNQET